MLGADLSAIVSVQRQDHIGPDPLLARAAPPRTPTLSLPLSGGGDDSGGAGCVFGAFAGAPAPIPGLDHTRPCASRENGPRKQAAKAKCDCPVAHPVNGLFKPWQMMEKRR